VTMPAGGTMARLRISLAVSAVSTSINVQGREHDLVGVNVFHPTEPFQVRFSLVRTFGAFETNTSCRVMRGYFHLQIWAETDRLRPGGGFSV
jgi:hypothetical protein